MIEKRLCLLGADTGVRVGKTDAELSKIRELELGSPNSRHSRPITHDAGLLNNSDALAARDTVGDLTGVRSVVLRTIRSVTRFLSGFQRSPAAHHQEDLDVTLVVDEEALVAVGHNVTRLLVGAVTNLGHRELALEAAANPVVNTCMPLTASAFGVPTIFVPSGPAFAHC